MTSHYLADLAADRKWQWEDLQEGAAEYLTERLGGPKPAARALRHPVAADLLKSRAKVGELAALIADPDRMGDIAGNVRALGAAIDTPMFSDAMQTAVRTVAQTRTNTLLSDLRAMCMNIVAPDYKALSAPVVDARMFADDADAQGGEVHNISAAFSGENLQVSRWSRNLGFTREAMLADDFNGFAATLAAITAAASRRVARSLCTMLTTNGNLKDGAGWFGSDNTVATGELSAAALSSATSKLMNAPIAAATSLAEASGDVLAAEPKWLLVPTTHLVEARVLVASMETEGQAPLRVVALPWLDGGNYFYMLPDPTTAPAIALATLTEDGPLSIVQMDPAIVSSDIMPWRVRLEFGLAPVSRSIVRGTLS